uniref:WASP actin nucleation promoting factor b n=1 Tax=Lepisosteus oculatus TaxID=7918 RepID=W5NAX1_LEPOC
MSRGAKPSKTQESCGSSLLSPQENERVFDVLGRKCVTMATTVAQLHMALPHSSSYWSLQHCGVLCFVKDNPKRSYFIRLYDIKEGTMIWEQELYNQFTYSSPKPYFHTFTADDCQAGLNFADEQEAANFQKHVEEKINQRLNRLEKRQLPPPPPPSADERRSLPPLPPPNANGPAASPVTPGPYPMATMDIQNPDILASRYRPAPAPAPAILEKGKKNKKQNKKKGSKLTKADIGAPSGFTHVSHVGWDPNTGFDVNNLDPDLKNLFSRAGISEAELADAETSKLIYDFIEQSGGLEVIKQEMRRQVDQLSSPLRGQRGAAPGVRIPPFSRSAPPDPLPPGRQGPLPPGVTSHEQQSRRDPGVLASVPDLGFCPCPSPATLTAQEMTLSFQTRHYTLPATATPHDSCHDRLKWNDCCPPVSPQEAQVSWARGQGIVEVRAGQTLTHRAAPPQVTENPDLQPSSSSESNEGIVGALMMVMQKRSKVIHSSDEGDDDGADDEDDDEWDD